MSVCSVDVYYCVVLMHIAKNSNLEFQFEYIPSLIHLTGTLFEPYKALEMN